MRVVLLAACAAVVLVVGCRKAEPVKAGDPEAGAVKIALDAVDRFHQGLASGNTAEICRSATAEAFGPASAGGCEQYFTRVKDQLGPFVSAKRTQMPIASTHPARVGVEYDATFKNGTGREHFEFLFSEGQPQLTSYRIKSDLLP
jgi:hypothetical protein